MKKNILNKIIFIILALIFILVLMTIKSNAASLSISTSKSSVSPGGKFTVTVSVSGGAGKVSTSVSNGSGGKTEFLDNGSYSFTCTAGSSGSVTISASGSIADYNTETESNKSASKTVKIVKPTTNTGSSSGGSSSGSTNKKPTTNTTKPVETPKSTDSTLSSLSVKEGKITPEFKKDVKEYSLTIPYETSEVNVTAKANDSKAKVSIDGNKDLKEGENTVKILVTAENGTSTTYTIKVIRKRVPIALKTLVVKYQNENGELIETPLTPEFNFDILEYTLRDVEHWVEKINIEAIPNIEEATVDIKGADTLQTGENTITITLKILEEHTQEGKEPKEETITYSIKVNKLEEPTLIAKIKDWFKGLMGTVGTWFNNNQPKLIVGALGVCIIALIGLSIYIVVDYNKYKDIIAKVKKVNEINSKEVITEEITKDSAIDKNDKPKGGKHF